MKYKQKSFLVPYISKEYRENWEKAFGEEVKRILLRKGDLVGVKEYGGHWTPKKDKWIEDKFPSYWFGIISEIKKLGDVFYSEDLKKCVKIKHYDSVNGEYIYSCHKKEDVYFVRRNVLRMWEKKR